MKFLVFSDSHRVTTPMDKAIEKHKDITHIIHCGDVDEDCEYLEMIYGRTHSICSVCGNNDYFSSSPLNRIIKCEGHLIYLTHGHKEHVKSSLDGLKAAARSNNADMCIYGHTHQQFSENENGLIVLNPGPINYISQQYAVIDVTKNGIDVELCKLRSSYNILLYPIFKYNLLFCGIILFEVV